MSTKTTNAYADCGPMSYARFAALAARVSHCAALWAADTCMEWEWTSPEVKNVDRNLMNRFLKDIQEILNHMDRSVK